MKKDLFFSRFNIKILIVIVLLFTFFSACNDVETKNATDTNNITDNTQGITIGKEAIDFTLNNIEGKQVKLSDYRGKTVILNFFGVWCSWCKKEMPGFIKVYNEYKNKDVELLIVDVGDTIDTVKEYFKTNGPNIIPVLDIDKKVSSTYRVNGFPTTLIIDSEGIIKDIHSGYMTETQLKDALDSVLKK